MDIGRTSGLRGSVARDVGSIGPTRVTHSRAYSPIAAQATVGGQASASASPLLTYAMRMSPPGSGVKGVPILVLALLGWRERVPIVERGERLRPCSAAAGWWAPSQER